MHPQTLEVRDFETKEAADAAGFTISLSGDEAQQLCGMNRKQRRAWLAERRRQERRDATKR